MGDTEAKVPEGGWIYPPWEGEEENNNGSQEPVSLENVERRARQKKVVRPRKQQAIRSQPSQTLRRSTRTSAQEAFERMTTQEDEEDEDDVESEIYDDDDPDDISFSLGTKQTTK